MELGQVGRVEPARRLPGTVGTLRAQRFILVTCTLESAHTQEGQLCSVTGAGFSNLDWNEPGYPQPPATSAAHLQKKEALSKRDAGYPLLLTP